MPTINALPNTLGEAVARCQQLMGDPSGRWVTRNYAVPYINQAYSDMAKQLKNASGKNLEAVVEVLNIAEGTSSLYVYQTYGSPDADPPVPRGPLVGLFDPIRMWVKTAGALPQYYACASGPRETLPFVNPPGVTPGSFATRVTFVWMGRRLSITPVAGPIDIQVYGRFNVPRLQTDEDELLLDGDMTDTLAYAAMALMGVERTNPAVLQGYADRATAGCDNIGADIIRQSQKVARRLAQMGGCGGTSWGWC